MLEKNVQSLIDLAFPPAEEAMSLWRTHFCPTGKLKEWLSSGRRIPERASYLSTTDYNVYLGYFLEGMETKLNWYKSVIENINVDDEKQLDPRIRMPCLFIGGKNDAVGVPKLFAYQRQFMSNFTSIELDATHWIMEEKACEVNAEIEAWLQANVKKPTA
jgi:soluble epoxide hydrolase / lipid-phosphate phosphatase